MKLILITVVSFFLFSCSGTKKVIEDQPGKKDDIAIVSEKPIKTKTPSIPKPIEPEVDTQTIDSVIPLPPKPPKPAPNIKELMHNRWNTILEKYVSDNGSINYIGIRNDRTKFDVYLDYLSETIPTKTWSKNEKLAYWINAYNALTVDLILRNYPIKSIKDIKDPWDQRLWKFGDKWYNLNDIEHQILRKMDEPRIHFAIVCASISCPKLQNKAFTAGDLDTQLTNATKEFLADTSKNKLSKDKIELSKIFKWFKKDFEQGRSLIDFLNQYSEISINSSAKKSYSDYNWDLND